MGGSRLSGTILSRCACVVVNQTQNTRVAARISPEFHLGSLGVHSVDYASFFSETAAACLHKESMPPPSTKKLPPSLQPKCLAKRPGTDRQIFLASTPCVYHTGEDSMEGSGGMLVNASKMTSAVLLWVFSCVVPHRSSLEAQTASRNMCLNISHRCHGSATDGTKFAGWPTLSCQNPDDHISAKNSV